MEIQKMKFQIIKLKKGRNYIMATLNLQKKKMMSESNYKRLVNILVGLMASQSTIESQCLFPYDETKTYSKNMICLYQNHLYLCKAATTGVFNPNAWELQDDIINRTEQAYLR